MRVRNWALTIVLLATLAPTAAWAKGETEKRISLTPFGGWTIFDREDKYLGGVRVKDAAYFGGRIGLRLFPGTWLDAAREGVKALFS